MMLTCLHEITQEAKEELRVFLNLGHITTWIAVECKLMKVSHGQN